MKIKKGIIIFLIILAVIIIGVLTWAPWLSDEEGRFVWFWQKSENSHVTVPSVLALGEADAIATVQEKYPELKKFSSEVVNDINIISVPSDKNVIVSEQAPDGWYLMFFGNFLETQKKFKSVAMEQVVARCYHVGESKDISDRGQYTWHFVDSYLPTFENVSPENCQRREALNIEGLLVCLSSTKDTCKLGLKTNNNKYYQLVNMLDDKEFIESKRVAQEKVTVYGMFFPDRIKKSGTEGVLREAAILRK